MIIGRRRSYYETLVERFIISYKLLDLLISALRWLALLCLTKQNASKKNEPKGNPQRIPGQEYQNSFLLFSLSLFLLLFSLLLL